MMRSLQLWSALLAVLTTTTIRERWNRQAMPAAGGMADAAAPDRFSRTRTVWPLEAGIGAAPPSMAKAASVRQRPAWDQALRTMAATIGPTPVRVSSSGRQARTSMVRLGSARRPRRSTAGCGGPGRAGWPRWRRSRGGLKVGVGPLTQPCAGANQAGRGQATQPAAEGVRGSDDQRMQLSLGVGGRLDRGAARRQPHRHRRAMAGRSGLGELLAGQGLAGRPGGVQGVGPGAVAAAARLGRSPSTTCSWWAARNRVRPAP